MAKPTVPNAGGVATVNPQLNAKFNAEAMARKNQGEGMDNKNATEMGYDKKVEVVFAENPSRSQ